MNLTGIITRAVILLLLCKFSQCFKKENYPCLDDDAVVHRILDLTFVQCQEECGKRRHCKAVNYRRSFKLCELLDTDQGSQGKGKASKEACTFLKKTDMPDAIIQGCNCSDGMTCDPVTKSCAVTECSRIVMTNAKLFGNMHSIGSRVKFRCNHGYVEVTNEITAVCEPTGQWSYKPNCIRDCGPIPYVANAQAIGGGGSTTEGAVVQYQCLPGYVFNGNPSYLTCTADVTWFDQANVICVPEVTIGDPCVSGTDCLLTGGICVESKCFCSPLYRYKPELYDCVKECNSFTDTFTAFANTAVSGYNMGSSVTIIAAIDCENLCRIDSNCLSFEVWDRYDYNTGAYLGLMCNKGFIPFLNILDADPSSIVNKHTIYNRDCV